MTDPYRLQRFVDAQAPVYENVVEELRAGAKRSHWMWFIFPQIAGLGRSSMAAHYAIGSMDEARAYLHHPLLGPRLRQCTGLVNRIEGRTALQIFGQPDNLKFHSSLTLFTQADSDDQEFAKALRLYFAGEADAATLARLAG